MEIEEMDLKESYIDLCSDSSDVDDSGNVNDNTESTSMKLALEISAPSLASVELCDAKSTPHEGCNSPCTVLDIEILEENNDDSNTNSGFIKTLQKESKPMSFPSDNRLDSRDSEHFGSPKAGCSKDFDNPNDVYEKSIECLSTSISDRNKDSNNANDSSECLNNSVSDSSLNIDHDFHVINKKLKKEANEICRLLPKFSYKTVYMALRKNWQAENRVELCLWDLLPNNRPTAKIPAKRKFIDDGFSNGFENIPTTAIYERCTSEDDILESSKDIRQNKEKIVYTEQSNIFSSTETKLRKEDATVNDKLSDGSRQLLFSGILQPPKFNINCNSLNTAHNSPRNCIVLSPPKLKYIAAPQHKNQTNEKALSVGKSTTNEPTNNKSAPFGRNLFSSKPNLPLNSGNGSERHLLYKYMGHLQFLQNTKRERLYGRFQDVNTKTQNKPRELFFHPQQNKPCYLVGSPNQGINIPQFVNRARELPLHAQQNKPYLPYNSFQFPNQNTNISQFVNKKRLPKNCQKVNRNNPIVNNLNNKKTNVTNSKVSSLHDTSNNVATIYLPNSPENVSKSIMPGIQNVVALSANLETLPEATASINSVPVVSSIASKIESVNASANAESINTVNSNNAVITILDEPSISKTSLSEPSTSKATLSEPSTSKIVHSESGTKEIGGARRKEIDKEEDIVIPLECLEMYEKLLSMFPGTEEKFLKTVCVEVYLYASETNCVDSTQIWENLIECILQNIDKYPVKEIVIKENDNVDHWFTYLSGVFPNADATYLKKVVARSHGDERTILSFIQSQCDHPNYPTKHEKLRRSKLTELQKQYTSNFDAKQFLKIFPDPFKHFHDPNRECTYSADALNFLKYHFKRLKESTLLTRYEMYKYNLSATVAALEYVPPDKTSEEEPMYSWEQNFAQDIPILQECAFITHKTQILECMSKLKKEEAQEFERLKKNKELLECQCCFDNECMPSKCSTCNDGHIFCNSCIVRGTESKLANGETNMSCFIDCDGEFSLPTLQKVLSPTQFSILIGKKQEAEVIAAGLEGLVSCPFCHFASIPPPEDKVFKCLNPECMKESCRSCKMLNHVPFKCHEKETDKARLLLEEKMTEALVRKCFNCSRPFIKEEGCNKISCSCGANMCYVCDQPVRGYTHFNNGTYNNSALCPLYSDSRIINTAVVEEVAKKTIQHITEQNPNVKLDTSLLPGNIFSVATSGLAAGATVISRRANKVANFDEIDLDI